MKRYKLTRYSIPGADLHESPDGDICMYADAQAEIACASAGMTHTKCLCTLGSSLTGDGCRYCQPQEYIDRLHDQANEDASCQDALEAEIANLKQQLATACILASTSAESAHHFAVALIDARGAAVGYWSNKPVEEAAQNWIDAQKPGVET